jgi:hypothetical protein
LWADKGTRLTGERGKLTCLEELQLYSVDDFPNFFTELGKLVNLRVLDIKYSDCGETAGKGRKAMLESLCNLHKIQCLKILNTDYTVWATFKTELLIHVGSLEDLAPTSKLYYFWLLGLFISRMPSWINSQCVPLLTGLCLHVEVVEAQDLQALGRLPSLMVLCITSRKKSAYHIPSVALSL